MFSLIGPVLFLLANLPRRGNAVIAACPEKISCDCTTTYIQCHNVDVSKANNELDQRFINELRDFILPTTTLINITGGNFSDLNANLFGNCSGDSSKSRTAMKKVILKNNNINVIHGRAFHCVPNLILLDLTKNNWSVSNMNHTAIFSGIPKLQKLILTDSMKDQYSGQRHLKRLSAVFNNSNLMSLREIYLGKNDIWTFTSIATETLCQTAENLRILDLHSNNIAKVVFHPCFQKMKNLVMLNLRDNSFVRVRSRTTTMFDQLYSNNNKFTVDLRGNQWDCDCHLKNFAHWLQTTGVDVRGKENYTCHEGGVNFGRKVLDVGQNELVCVEPEQPVNAGVVVISILFAVICCVIIVVAFLKRDAVKRICKGLTEPIRKSYFAKDSQFSYATVNNSNVDV